MSIPLLVLCIIGLLTYALAKDKVAEIGKVVFFCALLALCFGQATHPLKLY